jgi:type IV secretory pathway VirB2 component (pilin)
MEQKNNLSNRLWDFYSQNTGTIALLTVISLVTLSVAVAARMGSSRPNNVWQERVQRLRQFVLANPQLTAIAAVVTVLMTGFVTYYGYKIYVDRMVQKYRSGVWGTIANASKTVWNAITSFVTTHPLLIAMVTLLIGLTVFCLWYWNWAPKTFTAFADGFKALARTVTFGRLSPRPPQNAREAPRPNVGPQRTPIEMGPTPDPNQ